MQGANCASSTGHRDLLANAAKLYLQALTELLLDPGRGISKDAATGFKFRAAV